MANFSVKIELSQISDCTVGRGEALGCMDTAKPFQSYSGLRHLDKASKSNN
ncbi:unnamed protein product [Ixodes pacificus]